MTTTNEILFCITKNDYKVLKIYENEANSVYSFWVINSFIGAGEHGNLNDCHQVEGLEITDFFNRSFSSEAQMLSAFIIFLENCESMIMKFHSSFKWKLYISRTRKIN